MSNGLSSNQVSNITTRLEQVRQSAQDEASAPTSQYLRFQLGDINYALPISEVRGVDRLHPLTYVPGAPSFVLGVCNRRGVVLPCISLSELLGGIAPEINRTSRLVMFHDGEPSGQVGLLVDRLLDVLNLSSDSIEAPMATLEQGAMLKGQTRLRNGQMVLILEPEAVRRRITRRGESG